MNKKLTALAKREEINMRELIVKTPAFEHKGLIPVDYTGRGNDISPELRLSEIDERAKTIAVIMNDMGHLIPAFNHWVIWNIPIVKIIPANIPHGKTVETLPGAIQGRGYGKHRYRGPKPPLKSSHLYQFNVYTLDCVLDLPATSRKRDLLKAMEGHVLQQSFLCGHYR
jgi:Raf kinase inhibitor-like YbhB/YbcL family protein